MNVLVDADIIAYRAAFSVQSKEERIKKWLKKTKDSTGLDLSVEFAMKELGIKPREIDPRKVTDDICGGILYDCFYPEEYTLGENTWFYLTGSNNFRYDIATIKPYKGQRGEKPEHLEVTRDQLQTEWLAEVVEGQEADDAIGIKATELKGDCIIASIDKDLLMIPATHYNFGKKEWTEVSQEQGDYFFYKQLLTGDQVDNIQGVPGIGPKKAEKAYQECTTVKEMYAKALEMYKGDTDALLENARLLWLRRYEGVDWEPPV
ncbi:MAG: hypothetical protein MJH10_16745 [Epibacterium sp.]|nr:hypothetical protein [Epibacterium sp.]NQX75158.1 hypothetical protein [Epibacterium sp.]